MQMQGLKGSGSRHRSFATSSHPSAAVQSCGQLCVAKYEGVGLVHDSDAIICDDATQQTQFLQNRRHPSCLVSPHHSQEQRVDLHAHIAVLECQSNIRTP